MCARGFFFLCRKQLFRRFVPSVADKSVFAVTLISVLAELTFAQRYTSEWSLLFCHSRRPLVIQSGVVGSVENSVFLWRSVCRGQRFLVSA